MQVWKRSGKELQLSIALDLISDAIVVTSRVGLPDGSPGAEELSRAGRGLDRVQARLRGARRKLHRSARLREAGVALLLELLILSAILIILAGIALPNLLRIQQIHQQSEARGRVQMISNARSAVAICAATPGCVPGAGATALIPVPGSTVTAGGYAFRYEYTDDSSWEYTATPVRANVGQKSFTVGPDGIIR